MYRIEYVSYQQGPYRIRIDTADDRIVPALEASGWPELCKTEENRHQYIQQYYKKEGLLLDYKRIEKTLDFGHWRS